MKLKSGHNHHYISGQELVPVLGSPFTMAFEGKPLGLREFAPADAFSLTQMHQNPKVRALLIDDQPLYQFDFSLAFIKRLQEIYREFPGLGIWCGEYLHETPTDQSTKRKKSFAGWFNLMPIPDQLDEIELGSRLLPEFWGTGLALKGGEVLLGHAFNQIGCQRVWIACHPEHRSVDYIAHALGFERCGIKLYVDKPAQYYCLTHSRWQSWHSLTQKQKLRFGVKAYRDLCRVSKMSDVQLADACEEVLTG